MMGYQLVYIDLIMKDNQRTCPRVHFFDERMEEMDAAEMVGQRYLTDDFGPLLMEVVPKLPPCKVGDTDITWRVSGSGAYWSQRAGCSCPCSPGYILPHDREYKFDIHVAYRRV